MGMDGGNEPPTSTKEPIMSLAIVLSSLSNEVARNSKSYAAGRERHAALLPHATPKDVVAALASTAKSSPQARNAIIVALLEEHRTGANPLWQAILITAFKPMLVHLRFRLKRKGDEDLDQRVLVAFLNALRTVRMGDYAAIALRWATEKEVFLSVHKELRTAIPACEFDEETHPHDVFGVEQRDRERAAEILALLEAHGDELVEVVLATHAGDESLQELVDRKCAGKSASERACEYRRLARARQLVVEEIRASLSDAA